jgi:ATP-dependent helicase/nuclease subunit A
MTTSAPDQAARTRIRTDLDTNLFVEAGAGAGKTSSLVGRIIGLVGHDIDIGAIAAITFTEKAAAELRHRLRDKLADAERDAIEADAADLADKYHRAHADLDHAPIGTLHAFARRILNDYPVQAGLPPGFGVLDELESHLAFEERWELLLDQLLDEPSPAGGVVEGGSELIELCALDGFLIQRGGRRVAVGFHENWDLVVDRVDRTDPPPWQLDTEHFLAAVERVCATPCPPDDAQAERLTLLRGLVVRMRADSSLGAQVAGLFQLEDRCRRTKRTGAKAAWKRAGLDPTELDRLRQSQADLADQALELLQSVRARRVGVLGALIGRWVLNGARARAADGTIEFHDLLVLARRLLTEHPDVRAELHRRYRRVLLDEFQDTDPIQLEIAVRLTADPTAPEQSTDWTALQPLAGRLFIVGDPKQSIYRFRRADIAQYMGAAEQVGAITEVLSANFRSSRPVLDWVNQVFTPLIEHQVDVQPSYQPLSACRPHLLEHGSVTLLGVDEHADLTSGRRAEELRWREAADAADAVATALHQRWLVTDNDQLRPCRPGDITILLPARTSLPSLESALRDRDLPYRAENSSVVYITTEIRHLMLALRAADDATDQFALVAALRTPIYGCSDVELYDWKSAGGQWSIWSTPPDGLDDHPVAVAIGHVRSLAERSTWLTPADLLAALVDERRLLDVALDQPDSRDVWRRVRYVIDQARAWSDTGGHGVRRYLAWVHLLASESRNADTILPEHDDDAVRIMTVHAAKGLEFPITVLSGLTTKPAPRPGSSVVWHADTWTISSKHGDELYDDFVPLDEQMSDAERRRLLYVACTRAVDHLVVSLHRLPGQTTIVPNATNASLLHAAGAAEAAAGGAALAADPGAFLIERPAPADLPWADSDEWAAARHETFQHAERVRTVSATKLASATSAWEDISTLTDAGLDKEAVDLDLPPWQRGRYGTAVGRAVHAVLQFADLCTGADIDSHAAAQCAAEGIIGMDDTVAELARSALAAPIVAAALDLPHHRELFVAAQVGDHVMEGYIDLFVETDEGGIIVDYKTDQWPDGGEREHRISRYRRQLAAYGVALEQILGYPVAGGTLVRCRPGEPAEEIPLPNWADALDEARRAIAGTP